MDLVCRLTQMQIMEDARSIGKAPPEDVNSSEIDLSAGLPRSRVVFHYQLLKQSTLLLPAAADKSYG